MIRGQVNPFREARIPLVLRGPTGLEVALDAIVDTGFSDYLTAPRDLIAAIGLPWSTDTRVQLADGTEVGAHVFEAEVEWGSHSVLIEVTEADCPPLVGMALLYGSELLVQVVDGGEVTISPLA